MKKLELKGSEYTHYFRMFRMEVVVGNIWGS